MLRIKPATGEIYHLYNRGVEKRKVFLSDQDRLRFTHSLLVFNDAEPTLNSSRHLIEVGLRSRLIQSRLRKEEKKPLVEIYAFCLMPNHFHLMVKQLKEGGITEFMRKLGTGYTNYFNLKYQRVGSLFQGKYKLVLLEEEAHFIHLPYYIHLNPLDLNFPNWKKGNPKDVRNMITSLKKYRWSSHLDYCDIQNFPSIIQQKFLSQFFGGSQKYQKEIIRWLRETNVEEISEITLE